MKPIPTLLLLLLPGAALISSCASVPKVDAGAQTVLSQTTDKLKAAKTIRVSGTRTADPALLPHGSKKESVKFDLEAARPGSVATKTIDADGARHLIAGHGKLTWSDDKAKTYSTVATKATTIEGLVDDVEDQFDVKLVVAELLGADPQKTLLDGVTSGKVAGEEKIGGTLCTKLSFTQEDLAWDIWIAKSDSLPRQTVVTYTTKPGQPKRTVTISKWQLNTAIPDSDFIFTPAKGAQQVEVIH